MSDNVGWLGLAIFIVGVIGFCAFCIWAISLHILTYLRLLDTLLLSSIILMVVGALLLMLSGCEIRHKRV